jgi:hypothetical protein
MNFTNTVNSATQETVLVKTPANLFRGTEAVGGQLTITNQRILFVPHAVNFQTQPEEILIKEITAVGKVNTFGIVPNGMAVRVRSGQQFHFVIWKREQLIALLQQYIV